MQVHRSRTISGAGLGLRRELLSDLQQEKGEDLPDFLEVAPENWMGFGGRHAKQLRWFSERYPMLCHGLSLSIGGPHPINQTFVKQIAQFIKDNQIVAYSEHLSYTNDGGYLYDLLPIPMTESAVRYVAERIEQVQDILGHRLIIENVSTYAMPGAEMSEAEFVGAVLKQADCELLLDVNNVYVNSVNHAYDAYDFIRQMPAERVRYLHMAGHYQEQPDLLIDTHGSPINDPVWQLLQYTYQQMGNKPTLLERDFNIPALPELLGELQQIKRYQQTAGNLAGVT
jgi:uncharacterized protein (UPF0276 family)